MTLLMLQRGFDPFYQFMRRYGMALLYECTATLRTSTAHIRERRAELWLIVTDVDHRSKEPLAK